MKENMLDVLLYLFEHCVDEEQALTADEESIRNQLSAAGFQETEIAKAFSWLESLAQRQEDQEQAPAPVRTPSRARPALRVFSREEQGKIGPRSRALLLFLEQMDILKPDTRELVIDRIMALESEDIDLDSVRWVVLMVLFNQPRQEIPHNALEDWVLDPAQSKRRLH